MVELLMDSNVDKTIVVSADFASNLGASANLYIPIFTPTSPPPLFISEKIVFVRKMLPWPP
jgi:hypothetical protein